MRVLIVQAKPAERNALTTIIGGAGHEVVCARDATSALHLLEARRVDAAVIEHLLPGMTGHELVRRIRAQEGIERTWIVVTNALGSPGCVGLAMAAGADDFLVSRSADEVLARVDGMRRVGAWAKTAFSKEERAPRPDRLRAWSSAPESFSATLGDMFGQTAHSDFDPGVPDSRQFAVLPVSFVAEGYVVRVRVGFAQGARDGVCEQLLGQPTTSLEESADVLRELANVLAGVWKRLATNEAVAFSLGLPADASAWDEEPCLSRREWIVRGESGALVHVALELTQQRHELLTVPLLREGMVLVNDLHNVSGAMLLPGGTRLTRTHLSHLERALGCKAAVEVALVA